jgi:hypothetical protein
MIPMTSESQNSTVRAAATQVQNPRSPSSRQPQILRSGNTQNEPPSQTLVSATVLENPVPFERSFQLDGTEHESALSEVPQYFLKLEPPQTVVTFLLETLSQARAEEHKILLEFAAKKDVYHPLHAQYSLFGLEIVVTENPDLHLLVHDKKIFIQPLPPCLTNYTFFKKYVTGNLKPLALGFLYSYTRLIQHKSDYRIAREKGLLDEDVTWPTWQRFRLSLEDDAKSYPWSKHERYVYGELRLDDLDVAFLPSYYKPPSRVRWTTRLIRVLATFFTFYTVGLIGFQVSTGPTSPDANRFLIAMAYWYAIVGLFITALLAVVSYYILIGTAQGWRMESYKLITRRHRPQTNPA